MPRTPRARAAPNRATWPRSRGASSASSAASSSTATAGERGSGGPWSGRSGEQQTNVEGGLQTALPGHALFPHSHTRSVSLFDRIWQPRKWARIFDTQGMQHIQGGRDSGGGPRGGDGHGFGTSLVRRVLRRHEDHRDHGDRHRLPLLESARHHLARGEEQGRHARRVEGGNERSDAAETARLDQGQPEGGRSGDASTAGRRATAPTTCGCGRSRRPTARCSALRLATSVRTSETTHDVALTAFALPPHHGAAVASLSVAHATVSGQSRSGAPAARAAWPDLAGDWAAGRAFRAAEKDLAPLPANTVLLTDAGAPELAPGTSAASR